MTANHKGLMEPGNRILKRFAFFAFFSLCAAVAFATPPYDITVTFSPPSLGPPPDSYNLYIDDCAATGPLGAAFASVTTGQTFTGALTADGIYQVCVRAVNAAGEQPDPGPVATIDVTTLTVPNPPENLTVTVQCPNGACTVIIS